MKKTSGLTFRILLILLLGGGLIIAGTSGYGYIAMMRHSERIAQDAARRLSEMVSARFETAFRAILRRVKNFERYEGLSSQWILYSESVESRKLDEQLGALLLDTPSLSCVALLPDPATWGRAREEAAHAPVAVRSGDTFLIHNIADTETSDLRNTFSTLLGSLTATDEQALWMEPMVTADGELFAAATCAYPLEHGVLLLGVSSEWFSGIMWGIGAPLDGTIRILSAEGRELFRTAEELHSLATVYSDDIPGTGWRFEVSYPPGEIMGAATDLAVRTLAVGGLALLCTAILAALVTTSAARSLRNLKKNIALLTESFEGVSLPPAGAAGAEVDELTESVEAMQLNVARRIADAERILVVRESERKEFEIAAELRKNFFAPPIFEEARFSVVTHLGCSSRLRGVFYDVFPTDRGTVYLAVGETKGEGASSTLSLCAALSFLRAILSGGHKPNNAMTQLGELMSRFDTEGGGLSMLLAEFYPGTGICVLSNANYPNAMLIRGDESARIDLPEGAPVGAGKSDYANVIINMNRGDAILLYSADLVDGNGKPMSAEQLSVCAATAVLGKTSCGEALEALVREISGGAETRAVSADEVLMFLQYT